jgi:hypothetical protein
MILRRNLFLLMKSALYLFAKSMWPRGSHLPVTPSSLPLLWHFARPPLSFTCDFRP